MHIRGKENHKDKCGIKGRFREEYEVQGDTIKGVRLTEPQQIIRFNKIRFKGIYQETETDVKRTKGKERGKRLKWKRL